MATTIKRRRFVQGAAAVTAFNLLPSHCWAQSPNGMVQTAHIGVGGKGKTDTTQTAAHKKVKVMALCDVDSKRLEVMAKGYKGAKTYQDYRELFAELEGKIDAVTISTPDHTHAPATMLAMNQGAAVYTQKPLTHDIFEARALRLKAEETGLATQMGIQNQSARGYRMARQMIRDGAIGKVSRVHVWSFKNWGYDGPALAGGESVPEHLDWDCWIGTAAMRPFNKKYLPGQWRRYIDFGCGTLGDMGVHIFDTPYKALELSAPAWAVAECRAPTGIGHPEKNVMKFGFPGTKYTADTLEWTWYDGHTPTVEDVPDLAVPLPFKVPKQGAVLIGEDGRKMLLPHKEGPRLFPEEKFKGYKYPRLNDLNHYEVWIDSMFSKEKTEASFEYSARMTEGLLLGVVANRFPGKKLTWDEKSMKVTNEPDANQFIRRTYRKGYEVAGL
jgi:predicted dehydrogenase